MPNSYADAAYVAERALALVALFIVLGRAYLGEEPAAAESYILQSFAVPLAALLAMLNLLYLSVHLTNDCMRLHKSLVASRSTSGCGAFRHELQ